MLAEHDLQREQQHETDEHGEQGGGDRAQVGKSLMDYAKGMAGPDAKHFAYPFATSDCVGREEAEKR